MFSASTPTTARILMWPPFPAGPNVRRVPEEATSEEDAYLLRLGNTIQRVRKKWTRVSQEALGDRVNRDKNTISRWENGKTSLSAYDLARLTAALDCPCEWLVDPPDSITDLEMRIARLRRAAEEAARADAGEGTVPPSGVGRAARRGKG